ncbi:hypothetical protein [Streptomyces carpinensis]|uniref:hypothetical protein n=1 Tax=Streptomyces carpinensis TaxID=66369 RepID=UPI00117FC75E|nr:hypothetical protein [Streptomyces carpinensis]
MTTQSLPVEAGVAAALGRLVCRERASGWGALPEAIRARAHAVVLAGPESTTDGRGTGPDRARVGRHARPYRTEGGAGFGFRHPRALTGAPALPWF